MKRHILFACLVVRLVFGQQQANSLVVDAPVGQQCDVVPDPTQLQTARDRLAKLESALADVTSARRDAARQLGAGDDLTKWSNWLGGAQIGQGVADGAMSLYGFFTRSKAKEVYDVAKSVGDCANAALTETKTPAECIGSLAKSVGKALPAGTTVAPLGVAGAAIETVDKLAQGKTTDSASAAASTVSEQLKYVASDSNAANAIDGLGKSVVAVKAIADGDVVKGSEYIPKAIGKFVADETLSRAFDTTGELFKAGAGALDGIDTLSTARADGNNLNNVVSSSYDSIVARENDLSAKVLQAKQELDRLVQCQEGPLTESVQPNSTTRQAASNDASPVTIDELNQLLNDADGKQGTGNSTIEGLASWVKERANQAANPNNTQLNLPIPAQPQPSDAIVSGPSTSSALLQSLRQGLTGQPESGSQTNGNNAIRSAPSTSVTCNSYSCTLWQGSLVIKTWPRTTGSPPPPTNCDHSKPGACGAH